MNPIDVAINILRRVKNCDKALNNLKMARDNYIFNEDMKLDEIHTKYLKHVRSLIDEAIRIIEDEKD